MKLHLGCGKRYKAGYVNIDQHDPTVADELSSIVTLKYADDSVDKIESNHVLEHLGPRKSVIALHEWFRVLRPDGELILEIPCLEGTIQKFLNADRKFKESLLIWIFGKQKPGMAHEFIHSKELLKENLSAIGFKKVQLIEYDDYKARPVLKIRCQKTTQNVRYLNLKAKIRKKLFHNGIYRSECEDYFWELDVFLDEFEEGLKKYLKSNVSLDLENPIKQVMVNYPLFSDLLLDFCEQEKLISESNYNKLKKTTLKLLEVDFPSILYYLLKQVSIRPGKQEEVFERVEDIGRILVEKILKIGVANFHLNFPELIRLSKELKDEDRALFFLQSLTQSRANDYYAEGLKYYKLEEYRKAVEKFRNCVKLDRNNFFSIINLARLHARLNHRKKSIKYFHDSKKLIKMIRVQGKDIIKKSIKLGLSSVKKNMGLMNFDKPFENFAQIVHQTKKME